MSRLSFFPILFFCIAFAVSCKKPNPDNNVTLQFFVYEFDGKRLSSSTVHFDTVFSGPGSITRNFVAYNPSNSDISTSIFLAKGKRSQYSINVNGMPGTQENNSYFSDVTIPKKDSIFIFVKATINPGNQNDPFLVTDSIVFLTGHRQQDVKLLAYGQDANYIVANQGSGDLKYRIVAGEHEAVTWTKEKPYVVHGWAVIDSTGKLTIEPGTKVYFHSNSGLWAYRSSNLVVGTENGSLEEPVLFRGDRLESWFDDDYTQWSRVWVNEGAQVNIYNTVVTNATVGIQVEALPYGNGTIDLTQNSSVQIENTIIKNTQICGVLSRFLNIDMTNCLIINNGASGLQLEGGRYTMKHVTVANYFKNERKAPTCYISNMVSQYDDMPMDIDATFINCIITGKNEKEVFVNKGKGAELKAKFQNCLVKIPNTSNYYEACLHNVDPKFVDVNKLKFMLQSTSPAIGKGKPDIGVHYDIMGTPRKNPPDMGAYEF
jgi:hypothetical protein